MVDSYELFVGRADNSGLQVRDGSHLHGFLNAWRLGFDLESGKGERPVEGKCVYGWPCSNVSG
jgi:hypothetical protein